MSHLKLLSSIGRHFALHNGCIKLKGQLGTKHLSRGQRALGVAAGSHIARDSFADKIHRGASSFANNRLRQTTQRAWQDGVLTRSERNGINNARRDAGIGRQQVSTDNYRKAYGRALRGAYADGKITPRERRSLRGMRGRLRGMNRTLNRMKVNDRRLEGREAIQNRFAGNQVVGFNPTKFAQNLQFGCGSRPTIGHCGRQTLNHCGGHGGHWNVPHRPPAGHPRGSQYLSFGQKLGSFARGTQTARYTRSDAQHRAGASRANANYRNTVKNAWSDGVLTLKERNGIRNAGREARIANTHVRRDDTRRAYGRALRSAVSDGVLTPAERNKLGRLRGNLGRLGRQVGQLRGQDRVADRREGLQNFFAGNRIVGFNPAQFLRNLLGAA